MSMNRERFRQIESLFDRALGMSDAAVRETWLNESCATDASLLHEVRQLLRSFDSWTAKLNLPPPALLRCGAYECEELLGVGGMGAVYRGRRIDGQYQQEVAIKFLRGSFRNDAYHARFLAERQILANLNHPHIARLLDGGITADAEPYLVMEFVDGEPIDRYCDRRKLRIVARIALFHQVLEAVECAHRNLVVHRDLKPSNILVNRQGTVKLVDFGTSKLLAADATMTGASALTPAYASPEQLRGEPAAITDDVFSLGVVLFRLLTGSNPFAETTSYARGLERALRETTALSPDASIDVTAAEARSTTVAHLRKRMEGDLASILRKALAYDPALRYRSTTGFAEDLVRYGEQRPVLARHQNWGYIASRAIRRHARTVAALALLIAGLTGAALFSARQARIAQREADRAMAANRFLTEIFEIPAQDTASRAGLTVRELLELAQERVPPLLGADPAVATDLDSVLGNGFLWQGDIPRARMLTERARNRARQAGDIPRLAASMAKLSYIEYALNQFDAAWKESLEALDLWKRHKSAFTPRQSAEVLNGAATTLLYVRPYDVIHRQYFEEALALARRFPDQIPPASLSGTLQRLAESYLNVDRRFEEAHRLLIEGVAINRTLPRIDLLLQSLQSLGRVSRFMGNYAEDEKSQREAYELSLRINGAGKPASISQHSIWALSMIGTGRTEEAYRESRQALLDMRQLMPVRGSPLLWTSLSSASNASCLSRRFAECESLARESIESLGPQTSANDLRLTDAEAFLGMSMAGQGHRAEGAPYIERALQRNQSLKRRPQYSAALETARDKPAR